MVDVTSGHRTPQALVVVVHGDGRNGAGPVALVLAEAPVPLEHAPAEVRAPLGVGGKAIHLFGRVLSHVGDPEVAGGRVERESPRIAQAQRPDLRSSAAVRERVVLRDRVRISAHVQAQQRAEERVGVLAGAKRIAARPAVAKAEVEHSVRPERQLSAVVVRVRLWLTQHHGRGIQRCTAVADRHPRQHRIARRVGVVDERFLGAVRADGYRAQREAQQAALATGRDPAGQVEERLGQHLASVDDADLAGLFQHVEEVAVRHDAQRPFEAGRDGLEPDARRRLAGGRHGQAQDEGGDERAEPAARTAESAEGGVAVWGHASVCAASPDSSVIQPSSASAQGGGAWASAGHGSPFASSHGNGAEAASSCSARAG